MVFNLDTLVLDAFNESWLATGMDPITGPETATPEPVRRRFMGQADCLRPRLRAPLGGQLLDQVTFEADLTLEPDGSALLHVSDGPMHVVSDEGDVSCAASGAPQTYFGTSIPSRSESLATTTFGSTEDLIEADITGEMPEGTATTAFACEHRVYGAYRLDFQLEEVE